MENSNEIDETGNKLVDSIKLSERSQSTNNTHFMIHSRKYVLIYSDKKANHWVLGNFVGAVEWVSWEEEITKGPRRHPVVMTVFTIFLVKMISWVYTYVKINESVSFKCVQAEHKTIF